MAILASNYLTLADWAARIDPDGKMPMIVDLLSQSNPMIEHMPWIEGNLTTGHQTTIRTGLPSGTWRMLYQGIQPQKSTTAKIVDACGNLEDYSEVDRDLADLNGNTTEFRLGEDSAFLEGMSQNMASAFFYSSAVATPAQITGLSARYSTVQLANANTAKNVIDAGGVNSTNTSIWIVTWGPKLTAGIFPKGKKAGLLHEDQGREKHYNTDGSMYEVYRSHFKWESGLTVQDWRFNVRIANIDVTTIGTTGGPDLIDALESALGLMPTIKGLASYNQEPTRPSGLVGGGQTMIYCNRAVRIALSKQSRAMKNMYLTQEQFGGRPVLSFQGVPIFTSDALLSTEARVV